jgi:hypothetical protein
VLRSMPTWNLRGQCLLFCNKSRAKLPMPWWNDWWPIQTMSRWTTRHSSTKTKSLRLSQSMRTKFTMSWE